MICSEAFTLQPYGSFVWTDETKYDYHVYWNGYLIDSSKITNGSQGERELREFIDHMNDEVVD